MKLSSYLQAAIIFCACSATASPSSGKNGKKPPFFLLAGDSTTAIQSPGGGGWGTGFLTTTLLSPATGLNYGHNGATTVSFRDGGDWAALLSQIPTAQKAKDKYDVYVTLQFGHNDQKVDKNISLSAYQANLGVFVDEVRSYNATPILLTPLTRRGFSSAAPPRVVENLAAERTATLAVAAEKDVLVLDLNLASQEYCNAIGPQASWEYNLLNATSAGDRTHLNGWGSVVFGRMVSDLLLEATEGEMRRWTRRNETLSRLLGEGVPA